jgi:hypothetical protein
MPGIVARRRASSSRFAKATNAASKAAIRRSRPSHCARASPRSQAHPRAQAFPVLSFRQGSKALFPAAFALCNDDPALQKDGAQLIDQSGPFRNQALTRTMQRLHVQPLLAFQLAKPHGWACRGFGDSLSIAIIVLLRLDIRPHIFGHVREPRISGRDDGRRNKLPSRQCTAVIFRRNR